MKSYIVLGMGRFGEAVAKSLYQAGNEVLAVDTDEEIINDIQSEVTHAVIGDCTDELVLKALGARNFDVAVVSVGGKIETSVLATVLLKEQGVKYIVARATSELHAKILVKVGADRVIQPERDMGIKFAQSISSSNILDVIDLSDKHSIVEITPPKGWAGSSLNDLELRSRFGVTVLAVKTHGELVVSPQADYIIKESDLLVVVGENKDIRRIKD